MRRLNRLLLFIVLQAFPGLGQSPWTIYNTSNSGLPFDAVNCIAFEPGGLKWIGTESGLASFDGTTWTVYTTANSGLPDNVVRSLVVDGFNIKWIGTFLGGLARYDDTTWAAYNTSNSALPSNYIKALALDTAGQKWIGTGKGLVRYDDTVFTVYDLSNAPFGLSDNITDIHIDPDNVFRIGTLNGGFVKIVDTAWTVYTVPNGSGIPDNTQLEVDPDTNGVEWMATPASGLVVHPGGTSWLVYTPFTSGMPSFGATCLELRSNPDRVWVGTVDKGLVLKSGLNFVHYDDTNSPFPGPYVEFVDADANGILWIGTQGGGLVRLDESLLTGMNALLPVAPDIFPSPAQRMVSIRTGELSIETVDVADLAGHRMLSAVGSPGSHELKIDLGMLASGLYLVHIRLQDGKAFTKKLVKL